MARKKIYTDKKPPTETEPVETPEVETVDNPEPKKGTPTGTKVLIGAVVALLVAILTVYLVRINKENNGQ